MWWIIVIIIIVIVIIVWAVIGALADGMGNNPIGTTDKKVCLNLEAWWASQSAAQKVLKLAYYNWKRIDCRLRYGA